MIPESSGTIQILHQDDQILIIDKPPGMLTHRHTMDRHTPNVQAVLERQLEQPVYLVHRLDRMTSGVMLIALTREAAGALSLQFRNRSTNKRYLAIVRGHTADAGRIETPLDDGAGGSAEASTSFTTLGRGTVPEAIGRYPEAWFSLVRVDLHTGRRHQARRHLHQINHPVLGDNRHGDKEHNRWAAATFELRHLYLRAWQLGFVHPAMNTSVSVTAGLPALWSRVLKHLGIAVRGTVAGRSTVRIVE